MTDPISDMLTRLRNATLVRQGSVRVPYSRVKHRIVDILSREGWIGAVSVDTTAAFPKLQIELKYTPNGESVLRHVRRISKPGHRVYVGRKDIPVVLNNLGVSILSTSKGIMSNHEAKKSHVGGEVLCEVY